MLQYAIIQNTKNMQTLRYRKQTRSIRTHEEGRMGSYVYGYKVYVGDNTDFKRDSCDSYTTWLNYVFIGTPC